MTGQRVIGLETEYAIVSAHTAAVPPGTPPPLSPSACVDELYRGTARASRSRNQFMRNGARLYVDLGSHPEYATAECLSVRDAVTQDRAGERILADMAAHANARLAERGVRLHVLKNNVDREDRTFGCHENYQVERATAEHVDPGLVAFLAVRPVLTGAGAIVEDGEGARYALSARARLIERVASPDPTARRPLIVTREEPLADSSRFARLQVTYGDSNVCDVTSALKLGMTRAVLDLLESGGALADLALADPIAALHATAWDGPSARVTLDDGREFTSLELLEEVLARCSARVDDGEGYLARAGVALASLRSGRPEDAAADLDWAGKRQLLAGPLAAAGGDWTNTHLKRLDLAYSDLDPARGLAGRLRTAGLMGTVTSEESVERAMTTPPSDTRAAIRGSFVAAAEDLALMTSVSWTHVRLDSPPRPQLDLTDPLAARDDAVERLIEEMRALPPRTFSELDRIRAGLGPLELSARD